MNVIDDVAYRESLPIITFSIFVVYGVVGSSCVVSSFVGGRNCLTFTSESVTVPTMGEMRQAKSFSVKVVDQLSPFRVRSESGNAECAAAEGPVIIAKNISPTFLSRFLNPFGCS